MSVQFFPLSVTSIVKETKDAVVVSFSIPEELKEQFSYTAGQYITLATTIKDQPIRRSYSICTSPLEGVLSVGIKKVENGVFSTYASDTLKVGDILDVMPPNGKFSTEFKATQSKNYLLVASGSGITPIVSILKTVLQTEPNSTVTLVYSNKNRASIIFFEALEALKNKYMGRFQLIHLLSREQIASPINYGRIDAAKLDQISSLVAYNTMDEIFICGPEEMMLTARSFFEQKGIDRKKIHVELFGTARKDKKTDKTLEIDQLNKSDITVIIDGRSLSFKLATTDIPILDKALSEGADLPYACKGGVCCTCKAKLIEGTVNMDINYALEPEEVAAGYVLACQAHPTTAKVVLDFDIK